MTGPILTEAECAVVGRSGRVVTGRTWRLLGPDGPYDSEFRGTLGGHRAGGIYGRLDCPSAERAIAKGGYAEDRVFFADAAAAVACGYRPCANCLPQPYREWRERTTIDQRAVSNADPASPETTAAVAVDWLLEVGATVVSIGHGRSESAHDLAAAFERRWAGLGRLGPDEPFARDVGTIVDWPRRAASWLRPARRLADGTADHWFIADTFDGLVPVARRLLTDTDWAPFRTIAALVGAPDLTPAPPGAEILAGLQTITLAGHRGTVTAAGSIEPGRDQALRSTEVRSGGHRYDSR
jgi:hypothetical protein